MWSDSRYIQLQGYQMEGRLVELYASEVRSILKQIGTVNSDMLQELGVSAHRPR